ncbi:hypothetical protein [Phormidesmis sp. 146-33]
MTQVEQSQTPQGWQPYKLDQHAQSLVLQNRDKKDVLNESHKMRMTVAYGLERFWGEHLRLQGKEQPKADYWKSVWATLGKILEPAGIDLPGRAMKSSKTEEIEAVAKQLWELGLEEQRVALMVLTQLCDSLVWWTQRYKIKKPGN